MRCGVVSTYNLIIVVVNSSTHVKEIVDKKSISAHCVTLIDKRSKREKERKGENEPPIWFLSIACLMVKSLSWAIFLLSLSYRWMALKKERRSMMGWILRKKKKFGDCDSFFINKHEGYDSCRVLFDRMDKYTGASSESEGERENYLRARVSLILVDNDWFDH